MGLADLASPAIIGSFYEQLEAAWQMSWASRIGWLNVGSTQETETYKWLGSVPKFREWVGGRSATRPKVDSYSLRNKLWEQTLEFGIDDLRRDKTGQIDVRISELAQAGAAYWEDLLNTIINANGACYDTKDFFDDDHPVAESTTGSTTAKNEITATEVKALDVSDATVPTPDEAAKIIAGLVGHMMTFRNDQGHLLNSSARQFLIMCGTTNMWTPMLTAISQQTLTAGASNPLNGMKAQGYSFEVVLNPIPTTILSDDDVLIFRTDAKLKPFILQEEYGTRVTVIGAGSEEEFKNRRHLFGTERMGNAGYGLWQYAVRATLS
jgi:phage major head subunit gpT-like protein